MERWGSNLKMPLGLYKLVRVENDGQLPISGTCDECKFYVESDTPIMELTKEYWRIGASCPRCGCSVAFGHGNVMRMICEPPKGRESIAPDF